MRIIKTAHCSSSLGLIHSNYSRINCCQLVRLRSVLGRGIMSHGYILRFTAIMILISTSAMGFIPVCEVVYEYFPSCLEFLVGYSSRPSPQCCYNVRVLNYVAKRVMDPRSICGCVEAMVRGTNPPLIASQIEELHVKCGTRLSFPISSSMDCSR